MMKKLIDVFPDWLTAGIFSALQSYNVPWVSETVQHQLDIEYFTNRSGDKFVSPLIVKMMGGETLTQTEINIIAGTIYAIHGKNWDALWDTLSFEYDPIENYSMTERMTDDRTVDQYGHTVTRTDALQHTKTGTETETPNISETRTDDLQHTKTGTETETPDISETRTDALQHSKTGTDTLTHNTSETRTDALQHKKSGTETETPNTTETTTPALHNERTDSIAGFNSSGMVQSEGSSTSATGTNTVTKTGQVQTTYNTTDADTGTQTTQKTGTEATQYSTTDSDTGTQTTRKTGTSEIEHNITEAETGTQTTRKTGTSEVEHDITEEDTGTQTNAESGTDTHTRNYTLTRSGNIGVTTSQQMIQSERDLWKWNFYRDVVFPDIDSMLTLMIY